MVAPRSESGAKLPPRRNMARERPVLSGQGGSRSGRRFPSGFAAKIMTNEEAIEALARDPNFVTALRDGYFLRTPREDAEVFAASGEFAAIRRLLAARIENATVADVGAGRGLASYAFVRAGVRVVYAIEPSASARLGRGAIQSIPSGQTEAGYALGLRYPLILRKVLLPQVAGYILPAAANLTITLIKESAILSAITVPELTYMAQDIIGRTFAPVEIFTAIALLYWALTVLVAAAARGLERRLTPHLAVSRG